MQKHCTKYVKLLEICKNKPRITYPLFTVADIFLLFTTDLCVCVLMEFAYVDKASLLTSLTFLTIEWSRAAVGVMLPKPIRISRIFKCMYLCWQYRFQLLNNKRNCGLCAFKNFIQELVVKVSKVLQGSRRHCLLNALRTGIFKWGKDASVIFVILRFSSWLCKLFWRSNIFFNALFRHKNFLCSSDCFLCYKISNFSPSTSGITSLQWQYQVEALFKLLLSDSCCTFFSQSKIRYHKTEFQL